MPKGGVHFTFSPLKLNKSNSVYDIIVYRICFVWCIEENKSNGIVCYESDIQCRYFYAIMRI